MKPGVSGTNRKVLGFAVLAVVVVGLALWLGRHVGFADVVARRAALQDWARHHPALAPAAFFATYMGAVALSLPIATLLTLLGGALFGFWFGLVLVLWASISGACIALLVARYLLRDSIRRRYGDKLQRFEGNSTRVLLSLRLVPVVPFFVVNLGMGLTGIGVFTFAWVSLVGMLPATSLYVNAGAQLDTIHTPGDILSARVVLGLLALAALPFVAKLVERWWTNRAALRRWTRPKRFDYNLVVIGAGSAGLVSAYVAAAAGARVALVEAGPMGGECLNTGCVPSKALIASARLAHGGAHAKALGLTGRLEPDFPAVMARLHRVIDRIAPHDSVERYRKLGVAVVQGHARLADPWTVEVGGARLTTRRIVVATGAGPTVPDIPGLSEASPLTSDTLWSLTERPDRLLVLGGGAIGCELAQAFVRLGSHVTLVEAGPRLLGGEDPDVSEAVLAALTSDGVDVRLGHRAEQFAPAPDGPRARLDDGTSVGFDRVLVAVGRTPRVTGFGLEELGLLEGGRLVVDDRLRTRLPGIYAAGDVTGQLQFTHAASHYASIATANALIGALKSFRAAPKAFPVVVYTDPEVARVGRTEAELKRAGTPFDITRYRLAELDRAIVEGAEGGFVKVLTVPGRDRMLGVTIVGAHAGEMLGEFTLAMRHNIGLKGLLATIHPYPGWTEAAKATAGVWRRGHLPARALAWSERLLRWQRG